MPTYEYRCPAGHVFEKFYPSINNQRRAKCPTCGKLAERLISGGAALLFKGSGFYITDYKRTSENREEKKGEGEAKPASEAKPSDPKKPSDSPKKKPSGDR